METTLRDASISVFIISVPPRPPLSALTCSTERPPSHIPLQSATARVAACEAAVRRGVGRPPDPMPAALGAVATFVAGDVSCADAGIARTSTATIQTDF